MGVQLWASLLEKAYAKAHGSYQSMSGGTIAEALLDLTGCPTTSIRFWEDGFELEALWLALVQGAALKLPMGCFTGGDAMVDAVGLHSNHAYSIVAVRQVPVTFGERERLVRIRNPHGSGEWTGAWSDRSAEWSRLIGGGHLERTGVDDGTFWMDLTSFVQAFAGVDLCHARPGWHARSFPTSFPPKKGPCRVFGSGYSIRSAVPATVMLMVLQPSARGARQGREDRKVSYHRGEVSLLVVRLRAEGPEQLVGGGLDLGGAYGASSVTVELEPGCVYRVLPLCLGDAPAAAERGDKPPCSLRVFASEPVAVRPLPLEQHAAWCDRVALRGLHELLRGGRLGVSQVPVGHGWMRRTRANSIEVVSVGNPGPGPLRVTISAYTKSSAVRDSEGPLQSSREMGDEYHRRRVAARKGEAPPARRRGMSRWPAKWMGWRTTVAVAPGRMRVAMVVHAAGAQGEIGDVEARVDGVQRGGQDTLTRHFMGGAPRALPVAAGTFSEVPIAPLAPPPDEARALQAALEASRGADEDAALQAALEASRGTDEDAALQAALAASADEAARATLARSAEEAALREAMAASLEADDVVVVSD